MLHIWGVNSRARNALSKQVNRISKTRHQANRYPNLRFPHVGARALADLEGTDEKGTPLGFALPKGAGFDFLFLTSNLQSNLKHRALLGSRVYRIGSPESRAIALRVASRRRISSCQSEKVAAFPEFSASFGKIGGCSVTVTLLGRGK